MRPWILALSAVLLAGGSVAAQAGCENPPLVMIPAKDKFSNKEEKKITQATNKYLKAMQQYVACLQAELKAAGGDDAPVLYRNVLVQRNNAAVAEYQAVQKWYQSRIGKSPDFEGPHQGKRN